MWDLKSEKVIEKVQAHGGGVRELQLTADARTLFSLGDDGLVKLWDVERWAALRSFEGVAAAPSGASLSPDGRSFVVGTRAGVLRFWDVASGKERDTVYVLRLRD